MPHVFDETKKQFVQQHYNDVPLRNSKSVRAEGGQAGSEMISTSLATASTSARILCV